MGRDCGPAPGPAHSSLPATCVTCQCRTSTEPCSNLRLRCRLLCVPTCTASARYTGPITSRHSMSLHSQGCIESHRTRLQEQSSRTRRTGYSALSCVLASQDCTVRLLCRTESDRPLHSGLTGGAVDRPNEQRRRLALLIAIRSGKCIVQNCCAATSANLLSTNLGALTPGREGRSARERESAMARTRPPSSCSIRCTCTEDGRRDDRPEQV